MISKSSGKITKVSNANADDVEIKYGHIIQVLTDWIDTTILVSVDGRGMAKSTVIQARRSARCVGRNARRCVCFCCQYLQ